MNEALNLHVIQAIARTMEHIAPGYLEATHGLLMCRVTVDGTPYQFCILAAFDSHHEEDAVTWEGFVEQLRLFAEEMPAQFGDLLAKANTAEAKALFDLELLACT